MKRNWSAFEDIYAKDEWTNQSGPGSLPQVNLPLKALLETFISDNAVRSIVDFGCGDWQFMSTVDLGDVAYVGIDVVQSVIDNNVRRFKGERQEFLVLPDSLDCLPHADLYLFKDVMIHLSNPYILEITNAALSRSRLVLAVNNRVHDASRYNADIEHGGFRPVHLGRAPFQYNAITILQYGATMVADPRLPWIVARAMRRYVFPGEKHVQLLLGEKSIND